MRPRLSWYRHSHAQRRLQAVYERLRKSSAKVLGAEAIPPEGAPAPLVPAAAEAVSSRWRQIAANAAQWRHQTVRLGGGVREPGALGHVLAQGTRKLVVAHGCKFRKPFFLEKPPHGGYQLESLTVETFALDSGLHLLLKSCRNLKEVRLRITLMQPGILSGLLRNENLEKIDLYTFRGCTFNQLMAILRNCRRLTSWRSEGVFPLTARQMTSFVCEFPQTMRDLSLAPDFNNTLLDEHVDLLVRSCPKLVNLELQGCKELTGAAVAYIQTLHQLESLDVTACPGLRFESLRNIKSIRTLRTLDVSRHLLSYDDICKLRDELPDVDVRTVEAE